MSIAMRHPPMPSAMGQGGYWLRPSAPPAAFSIPPPPPPPAAAAAAPFAPPAGRMWETDEVRKPQFGRCLFIDQSRRSPSNFPHVAKTLRQEWIQEQRLCQTALAVAGLVFRDEEEGDEQEGMMMMGLRQFQVR